MSTRFYEFGPFQIDKLNHVLLRDGETLPLKPKVFDTLLLLVENRGRVLDKEELLTRLWPDTVVEESNLSQNVYLLRKVLGEEPREEAYIETMPKRGYRFVATVHEVEDAPANELIPEGPLRSQEIIGATDKISIPRKNIEQADQVRPPDRWKIQPSWRRLGVTIVAGFLLVFGVASVFYVWTANKSKPVESRPPIKSIAVLPFKS